MTTKRAGVLYSIYWIGARHGRTTVEQAMANSRYNLIWRPRHGSKDSPLFGNQFFGGL